MKTTLLILSLVCLNFTAHARLGETRAECAKRYGSGTGQQGAVAKATDPVIHYSKHGVRISAAFNPDGRCGRITYSNVSKLPKAEIDKLRSVNSTGTETNSPAGMITFVSDAWRAAEAKRHADSQKLKGF